MLSGRQIAGCCVHVASVIYYLSIKKEKLKADPNFLKYPAKHLNEIFVDTKKLEEANNPKIVKHKRRYQILKEYDQNLQRYEEISSYSSDDAEDVISSKKKKKTIFSPMSKDNIEIIEKKDTKGISKFEKIKLNDLNSYIGTQSGTQNNIKRPKTKKAYQGKSLQKDLINI